MDQKDYPSELSGEIEIDGTVWKWSALDRDLEPPSHDSPENAVIIAFYNPDEPNRELRSVARHEKDVAFSEEELRKLFEDAWAVRP